MAADARTTLKPRSDLPLEEVPCYLCGRRDGPVLVDDPPFKVRLCAGCGLGYTSPRIAGDRIHELYDSSYWSSPSAKDFGYTQYRTDAAGYLRTFRRRARALTRHRGPGRLLEVGCAAGFFLEVMREAGWEVSGVEVSKEILETARARLGPAGLHHGRLDEVDLPEGHFDAVAMWDVVEHLADPLAVLARCRRLLREGGLLVLQTQDVGSRFRKLLGARWHHFKQMEHIYHFTPATIRTLLDRAGFDVVDVTRRWAGKDVSLDFIAERAARLGRLPALFASPLRLLGRRFVYVNPRDEMIVVARRRPE